MKPTRLIIYSQDIQRITGRSERYAQYILSRIRKSLGKEKHQLVTWEEFCEFSGLQKSDIDRYL
jgi:hypothetical protein